MLCPTARKGWPKKCAGLSSAKPKTNSRASRILFDVSDSSKRCVGNRSIALSVTPARAGSVNTDGLQLVAPCIRDRGFPAVGQHDRRAVGGMQGKQLQSRRDLRRLGEQPRHVLGTDLLHIGDMALAQGRQRLGGDACIFEHYITFSHGLDSSVRLSGRVRYSFHYSCSLMAIVLTIFSGSGRARSIDNSPFFKSAPKTCIPSASTKVRWKWRAAMPRWIYCRALSSCWRPRITSWFSSMVTSSWSRVNPATASVIRRHSGWPLPRSHRSMLYGG